MPKYKHDCDACLFLGEIEVRGQHYDIYTCMAEWPKKQADERGEVGLIARYGDGGPEYASMTCHRARWEEAAWAYRRGLDRPSMYHPWVPELLEAWDQYVQPESTLFSWEEEAVSLYFLEDCTPLDYAGYERAVLANLLEFREGEYIEDLDPAARKRIEALREKCRQALRPKSYHDNKETYLLSSNKGEWPDRPSGWYVQFWDNKAYIASKAVRFTSSLNPQKKEWGS